MPSPLTTPTVTPSPVPSATPTNTPTPLTPLAVSLSWRFPTLETVWAVRSDDLDGDGAPEVLAASYDKRIYVLSAEGAQVWRYETGGPLYCLGAGDLDGDGRLEVVVGGDDNTVHVLRADGVLLWQQQVGSRVVSVDVASAGADGQGMVLVGSQDGQVLALAPDGQVLWQLSGESALSSVLWVDLYGDGALEGLVAHQDGAVSLTTSAGEVQWTYQAGGHVRELRAYDLDGDGRKEVIFGCADGWLHVLTAGGEEAWSHNLGAPAITVETGDLDGDGRGEVLAGTGGSEPGVYLLGWDGGKRWFYQLPKAAWAVRQADLDGDGQGEILVGGDDGNARILDSYGRLLGGYQTGRRVHGLDTVDVGQPGVARMVFRSGNDVGMLTLSASTAQVEDPVAMAEPASLPGWQGPLPGLPEADEALVEVVFVGDVMLSRTVEERMEVYGSRYPFEGVADLLRKADLTIGNLEAPFSLQGQPLSKRFVFRVDPRHADGLSWAGFDVVTLANNHLLDFGQQSLTQTLDRLGEVGVAYVGAGRSYQEAHRPLVWEGKGTRIAFLAYAATRWKGSHELPTSELGSFAELGTIQEEVRRATELADLVVVVLHLGTEYQVAPDQEQLAASHAAIDAGACLVVGHHSHVVQGWEEYRGGLIAYGLGNFVFDIDVVEASREGAILRVLFSQQGVEAADLIPVRIVDDVQPQLMSDEQGQPVVKRVFRSARAKP